MYRWKDMWMKFCQSLKEKKIKPQNQVFKGGAFQLSRLLWR